MKKCMGFTRTLEDRSELSGTKVPEIEHRLFTDGLVDKKYNLILSKSIFAILTIKLIGLMIPCMYVLIGHVLCNFHGH